MNHSISTAVLILILISAVFLVVDAEFQTHNGWTYEPKGKVAINPLYFERGDDSQYMQYDDGYLRLNTSQGVVIQGNLKVLGNLSVKRPYGMYASMQIQTMAAASTRYNVTFDVTEDSYEIIKAADNFTFRVQQDGDYLIELSAIFDTTTPNKHVELWPSINGVNVPRSNTRMLLPTASTEMVLSVPFILDLHTTDYFTIHMATDDPGARMIFITNTSYSPATPSIIMTISKISEITD